MNLISLKSIASGLLGLIVIVGAFAVGVVRLDLALLANALNQISIIHVSLACMAILAVMMLSTTRFQFINRKFGGSEDWIFLHRVNIFSMIYSQIALPLISQIIGRIGHGSSERRVYYAPLTLLEKSMSFAIMICFGGAASYRLLNQNIIPEGLGQALALITGAILLVLTSTLVVFFNASERQQFFDAIRRISSIGLFTILSLSVLIQLGILGIYVLLALQFLPDTPLITLVGAFAIVILATSIPIGFGGWGVREAAAAGVFFALGLPPEIGVVIGLLYGVLHLVILVVSALILQRRPIGPSSSTEKTLPNLFEGINFWPLTFLLIMVLLPFQIRLPLGNGIITLNSVDVIALVVMINFTLVEFLKGQLKSIWTDKMMWFGLACLVTMIAIGWLVGWLRFGSNEWATANRLLGLIPVFSYLFTGAAMRRYISPDLIAKLSTIFVFSLVSTIIIKIVSHNLLGFESPIFFNWRAYVSGFIADRNALGFMASMAAILVITQLPLKSETLSGNKDQPILPVVLLTILMTFVVFSGTRTGLGAAIIILAYCVLMQIRQMHIIVITSIATVLMMLFVNAILPDGSSIRFFGGRGFDIVFGVSNLRSDLLEASIMMFKDNMIIGGGLGAAIQETEFVVHNLFLWILAEMGLVGVALSTPIAVSFLRTIRRRHDTSTIPLSQNQELHAIALFIMICGGFSLFQDIAYQRILWLLIGFMMARPVISVKTK